MGANIKRDGRKIEITGVEIMHGTTFSIMPDRNEAVTFAILSALTGGDIVLEDVPMVHMKTF